ncbi:MAG: VWA domain-containing protein [Thermoanaerobaculia bacterium]
MIRLRATVLGFAGVSCLLALASVASEISDREATAATVAGFEEPIELLMAPREAEIYRRLSNPRSRQRFMDRFWMIRGEDERADWERRLLLARSEFEDLGSDRARLFLVAGPPLFRMADICPPPVARHEIWHYAEAGSRTIVFVAPELGAELDVWKAGDWTAILGGDDPTEIPAELAASCARGSELVAALRSQSLPSIESTGDGADWVSDFLIETTLVPDGAERFDAALKLNFPEAVGDQTAMLMIFELPGYDPGSEAATAGTRAMLLTGEIFGTGTIDEFRFLYSGTAASDESVRFSARRHLEPGSYRMVVKLQDTARNSYFRTEREFDVPSVVGRAADRWQPERQIFKLLPPPEGYLIGNQRFDTIASDPRIAKVRFFLDGEPIMTKNRPPFSLELDLGEVPRPREVEAVAFDKNGVEAARDRISVNSGPHRFAVRVVNPRAGSRSRLGMTVHAEVETPLGEELSHVDLFWNERWMARLFQAPFVHSLDPPEGTGSSYLRAVAVLEDGHSAEDLVVLDTSDTVEAIDIDFVELYASVVDKEGEAIEGLKRDSFSVFEDDVEQEIRLFRSPAEMAEIGQEAGGGDAVGNRPINALVVLDSSQSMIEEMEEAEEAAAQFFEKVIKPKDRAAIMAFADTPQLLVPLTNNLVHLKNGLVGIEASGETTLYDTLVYGLYYLAGLRGKRVLILLSDGADSTSRFDFLESLDYAKRSGVAIYTIGIGLSQRDVEAQSVLRRLAHETGGENFTISGTRRLGSIYEQIERELRAQYLIGYQSPQIEGDEYRRLRVEVAESGLSVKTAPGYYP